MIDRWVAHGRAAPIISCICRINETIYTNHTEIRENGMNWVITFDCHVGIFIHFEIYRKGNCRIERVVLSTIIYTCIVSFVQVHDENKYTEVGYIGYEFNINNSSCLWVARRSQWGTYMIYAQNGDMILDATNRTAIKSIHILHGFQVYFLWSSLTAKSILIKSYLMMTVCATSLFLRYYAI